MAQLSYLFIFLLVSVCGQVSPQKFACPSTRNEAESCADLPVPDNGRIVSTNRSNGILEAELECDAGYTISGNRKISCKSDTGNWSSRLGLCVLGGNVEFEEVRALVELDNPDALDELLEFGKLVNVQNQTGWTSLHLAALYGSTRVARYLINHNGTDVHLRNGDWLEAIHVAALRDQDKVVELLLENNNNTPNVTSLIIDRAEAATGRTPIFYAGNGGLKVAKLLLERGANAFHCDHHGMQPVHFAIANKQVDLIKFLASHDLQVFDAKCCGALAKTTSHLVAEHDFSAFLDDQILAKMFDVNAVDGLGRSPLCLAAMNGSVAVIEKLAQTTAKCPFIDGSETSLLHIAAHFKQQEVVEWLLDNGFKVATRDSLGRTALHIIAMLPPPVDETALAIAKLLLQYDEDLIEAVDSQGRTAFLTAVVADSQQFAETLQYEFAAFPAAIDANGHSAFHLTRSQRFLAYVMAAIPGFSVEINRKTKSCSTEEENCLKNGGLTPLQLVIKAKKPIEMMRYMLNFRADPNSANDFGQSALHIAVDVDYRDAVSFLVKKGANPLLRDRLGRTALMIAVEKMNINIVKLLINNESAINLVDFAGKCALHRAIELNFTDAVRLIANSNATNMSLRDPNGRTPLLLAVEKDNLEIVKFLAKTNAMDEPTLDTKDTPLMLALKSGHIDIALFFVQNGADVNAVNLKNETASHLAVRGNFSDVLEALVTEKEADLSVSDSTGRTPLLQALEDENEVLATIILNANQSASIIRHPIASTLETPLHIATRKRMLRIVELLVKRGADSSVLNGRVNSPLQDAVRGEDIFLVKLMLGENHQANLSLRDSSGRTPLLTALEANNEQIVRLILTHVDDSMSLDLESPLTLETPLHLAVKKRMSKIVELLLEKGADLSLLNANGNSPLHEAIIAEDFDMVRLLVNSKTSNLSTVTAMKRNVLHLAVKATESAAEMVKLLVSKAEETNQLTELLSGIDDFGETPLHRAVVQENKALIDLLLEQPNSPCDIKDLRHGLTAVELAKNLGYDHLRLEMQSQFPQCRNEDRCPSSRSLTGTIHCGQPPLIRNGIVTVPGNLSCTDNLMAEINCSSGYQLIGSKIVRCRSGEGRWLVEGFCQRISNEPSIENGRVTATSNVRIVCNRGYYYEGSCSFGCGDSGNINMGTCRNGQDLRIRDCRNHWEVIDASCHGSSWEGTLWTRLERGSSTFCWLIKAPEDKQIKYRIRDFHTSGYFFSSSKSRVTFYQGRSRWWGSAVHDQDSSITETVLFYAPGGFSLVYIDLDPNAYKAAITIDWTVV